MSSHEATTEQHAHVLPPSTYVKTLLALVVLMFLTVWAAQQTFPGGTIVNNIIAMTIAVIKGSLVIMFFMGVKYGTKLTKLWAAIGFVWFTLLFMIFADYMTRHYEVAPSWDKNDIGSAMAREKRPAMGPRGEDIEKAPEHDKNLINVRPR